MLFTRNTKINLDKPGVIVIGGHVQGLGIIRIFGQNNIPTLLIDNTKSNIARHSKYCDDFYNYQKNQLLDFLADLKNKHKYKNWLLLPTKDLQVKLLSQNKEILSQWFTVGVDKWSNVKQFFNKRNTYRIAQDLNIDIPKTFFPNSITGVESLNLDYPCIIKPAVMQTFYETFNQKVLLCHNRTELIRNYRKTIKETKPDNVIVQEVIPGNSENQYSACFLYNIDEPVVQLVGRRKRQHPPDFGNATTFAETVKDKHLITIASKLLNYVGYRGICEVEFKYDQRDDKYKLLEVNPRTWKWHAIALNSNSPFLMSYYKLLNGRKVKKHLNCEEASFQHLLTDIPTSLKLLLSGDFNRSKVNNTYRAVWQKNDLKPGLYELAYLPYLLKTR